MWPRSAIFALLFTAASARAQWPFPAHDGSTWQYILTREPNADQTTLTRQIWASGNSRSGQSIRLQQAINGVAQVTQFLRSDHDAVLATSQRRADGKTIVFDPPVMILPAKLETGASWNFRGNIAGIDVALPLRIAGEEEIAVPAGKF